MSRKKRTGKNNAQAVPSFSADYRAEGPSPVKTEEEAQDVEIDDFLPQGEDEGEEEALTKWEGQLEPEPDPQPEEEPLPPPAGAPEGRAARHRGKRRYGIFLGSLVLLLALAGVVSIAGLIGTNIYRTVTDDSALRAYDSFLSTIVMQDPQPFDSPEEADPLFVQNAALWETILKEPSAITGYDDVGRAIIPLGSVAAQAEKLFGPDCPFSPSTPSEETFYTFDSSDNTYHVSLFSSDSALTPYTESSRSSGGSTFLRVGYVAPTDEWRNQGAASSEGAVSSPSPVKYMEYEMRTNEETGEEYLYAVRELEE